MFTLCKWGVVQESTWISEIDQLYSRTTQKEHPLMCKFDPYIEGNLGLYNCFPKSILCSCLRCADRVCYKKQNASVWWLQEGNRVKKFVCDEGFNLAEIPVWWARHFLRNALEGTLMWKDWLGWQFLMGTSFNSRRGRNEWSTVTWCQLTN